MSDEAVLEALDKIKDELREIKQLLQTLIDKQPQGVSFQEQINRANRLSEPSNHIQGLGGNQ